MYDTFLSTPESENMSGDYNDQKPALDESLTWLTSIYDRSDLFMAEKFIHDIDMKKEIDWSGILSKNLTASLTIVQTNVPISPPQIHTQTKNFKQIYKSPMSLVKFEDENNSQDSLCQSFYEICYIIFV